MLKPEQDYLQHLREGRFMLPRGKASGRCFFYPRAVEPGTGATDLEWVQASGRGTVYSVTVVRKKTAAESYNVALVDLAEGPRMMSRIDGIALDAIRIGMPVRAQVLCEGEEAFVVFVPEGDAA
jgi:uncharacterized OB-fold protein